MPDQALDSSRSMPRRARQWAPVAGVATMLGMAGLMFAAGAAPGATDFAPAARAWTAAPVQADTALSRAAHRPTVGDEGFWLSRHDLAGSTASGVKLGDRISIASPGDADSTKARSFEVVELKPVHDTHTGLSPTSNVNQTAVLTMVVAREVDATASTPRVLRFLIEGAASLAPTPSTPDAVRPPDRARTL